MLIHTAAILDFKIGGGEVTPTFQVRFLTWGGVTVAASDSEVGNFEFRYVIKRSISTNIRICIRNFNNWWGFKYFAPWPKLMTFASATVVFDVEHLLINVSMLIGRTKMVNLKNTYRLVLPCWVLKWKQWKSCWNTCKTMFFYTKILDPKKRCLFSVTCLEEDSQYTWLDSQLFKPRNWQNNNGAFPDSEIRDYRYTMEYKLFAQLILCIYSQIPQYGCSISLKGSRGSLFFKPFQIETIWLSVRWIWIRSTFSALCSWR